MNNKIIVIALSLVSYGTLTKAESQALPQEAVAVVNEVSLPAKLLDQSIKLNVEKGKKDTPDLRKAVTEELIARELFAQESTKKQLDQTPEAKEQLAILKQSFLIELLTNDYLKSNPISEEEVKAAYEKLQSNTRSFLQYNVSHIVVANEADAKDIITKLNKGEAFEKLANSKSIDPTKNQGGNIGWVLPTQIIPEIANSIVIMSKNMTAQVPVHSHLGWHVLKLLDIRPFKVPAYDDVKVQIRSELSQVKRLQLLNSLKQSANIIQ
jgi:peptidyl-prolyl cis-trans isomerase C